MKESLAVSYGKFNFIFRFLINNFCCSCDRSYKKLRPTSTSRPPYSGPPSRTTRQWWTRAPRGRPTTPTTTTIPGTQYESLRCHFFFSSGLARDAHSNHLSDNVTLFFIVVIGTVLYSISYGNSVLTPKADSFLSFCKSRCREA